MITSNPTSAALVLGRVLGLILRHDPSHTLLLIRELSAAPRLSAAFGLSATLELSAALESSAAIEHFTGV